MAEQSQDQTVPERIARMVAFLMANAQRIARLDPVQITFYCKGGKVGRRSSRWGRHRPPFCVSRATLRVGLMLHW